ncbi:MAG: hypothetical protein VX090_16510, partial [Pseudomonadota bacterium]|nr:hypothetical protein [Pseudomonadota bacterium]
MDALPENGVTRVTDQDVPARRALVPDGTGVDIHTYKSVPMNLMQAVVGSRSDSAHADNRDLRA